MTISDIQEYAQACEHVISYMQAYHPDPKLLASLHMVRSTIYNDMVN